MFVTILLLAQIVQSWPWLDSPLVQPGPTICVGECAGPVVWGPAERGRLVVTCDMTSDTCSDGRKITTTRATPVPCEVSPGVLEMVPEDTGCYSVRGLESWAANTSYLSWGAELDRSPWTVDAQASIAALPDGGYRVCHIDPAAGNHGLRQLLGGARPETLTVAAIARANTAPSALIGAWSQFSTLTLPVSWNLVAVTKQTASGASGQTFFYPRPAGQGRCIDLLATWLTHTDTPGRACWGGEAPVTCAADRHTISTEGWPTTEGEISMVVELNEPLSEGRNAWLFDGRDAGDLMGVNPYIQPDGRLRFRVAGTVYGSASPMLTWEVGRPYALRFLRKGGQTYIYRDGALVYSVATPDWAWVPSAHLGMNFSFTGPDVAIAIRSLTVRSYEEVSP